MKKDPRIIISGGGTGGHVYPAIAIADALREQAPAAEILFVGARGKLEMEKVPQAGYPIEGLWISGFQRSLNWRNLLFPLKLVHSLWRAGSIVRRFRPDVAVGVGGYASGPLLEMAVRKGVPTLIQEQNSYAGVTNKLLGRKADRICVAYEGMERFFPAEKLVVAGNPVREAFLTGAPDQATARRELGLDPAKRTVFVFGGSLGARTLNRSVAAGAEWLQERNEVQLIWQVGKLYWEEYRGHAAARLPGVQAMPFIDRMDLAYAAADLVVCRAGALTISELSLIGKAAILLPSPNVAEDHQSKNAQALVEKGAAVMIADAEAESRLWGEVERLLNDASARATLENECRKLGKPGAARRIAGEVLNLIELKISKVMK